MPLKTLICGAYTYGNQGDDAIKSVLVRMLRNAGVQQIIIARPYPEETFLRSNVSPQNPFKAIVSQGGRCVNGRLSHAINTRPVSL